MGFLTRLGAKLPLDFLPENKRMKKSGSRQESLPAGKKDVLGS